MPSSPTSSPRQSSPPRGLGPRPTSIQRIPVPPQYPEPTITITNPSPAVPQQPFGFAGDAIQSTTSGISTMTEGEDDDDDDEDDEDDDDDEDEEESRDRTAGLGGHSSWARNLRDLAAPTPANTMNNDPFATTTINEVESGVFIGGVGVGGAGGLSSPQTTPPLGGGSSISSSSPPKWANRKTSFDPALSVNTGTGYDNPSGISSMDASLAGESIRMRSTTRLLPDPSVYASPTRSLTGSPIPNSSIPIPPPPILTHSSFSSSQNASSYGAGAGSSSYPSRSNSHRSSYGGGGGGGGLLSKLSTPSVSSHSHTQNSTSTSTHSQISSSRGLLSKFKSSLPLIRYNSNHSQDLGHELGSHAINPINPFGSTELGPEDQRMKQSEGEMQLERDRNRLEQLGYSQVLGRDYGFWACFSVSFVNIGFLQGTLNAIVTTFEFGGPSMILTMWPIGGIFLCLITLSMGELASAYPVAGGMASWAWKCARGGVRGERGWGWVMTGIVMGFHVGSMSLLLYQTATIVVNIIDMASDSYNRQAWHVLSLYIAVIPLVGGIGSVAWGRSPRFWTGSAIYLTSLWIVICVSLLAAGASRNHTNIYKEGFMNQTAFTSKAYIYVIGWTLSTIATGADASAHIAEETQNPSRNVPLAMFAAAVASYVMGYVSILILLLSIDPSEVEAMEQQRYSAGYILQLRLGLPAAVIVSSLLGLALILQCVAQLQASSRFMFAISRDQAIPFHQFLIQTKNKIPLNATWIFLVFCLPISFALWQSPAIAGTVLSFGAGTLCMIGYGIPILLYLLSKMDLQTEGRTDWSLRRYSRPIGWISCLCCATIIVCMVLPTTLPVTAETFSWSPGVVAGTLLLSLISWKIYGDKNYSGPVKALTRWEAGHEIDLQTTLRSSANTAVTIAKLDDDESSKATARIGESNVLVQTLTAETSLGGSSGKSDTPRATQASAEPVLSVEELVNPNWTRLGDERV